jgi:maleate isomerase
VRNKGIEFVPSLGVRTGSYAKKEMKMEANVPKMILKPWPLGWKAKIAILLPAHDTGYGSYEFQVLCPEGVVTLETRVMGGNLTTDELKKMRADALHGAELLACAGPVVICYIGTAACFVLGVEGEKALMNEIEDRTGIKAAAGGDSVARGFKALGVKRISLYVPTNAEITKMSVKYFEDQGLEVKDCLSLGEESIANINRISPWEHYGNMMKVYKRCPDVEGIFVTGGCQRVLEMLETVEKDTGIPFVMTTAANMWRCLQLAGVKDPVHGFGQLLEKAR